MKRTEIHIIRNGKLESIVIPDENGNFTIDEDINLNCMFKVVIK